MRIQLVRQPNIAGEQVGPALASALANHSGGRFHAVVAWVKSSGLSRMEDAIRNYRADGGHADLVVGLDANGATWEGLALAINVFDVVHVFHDPGSRTFHPKCYIARDATSATLVLGSSNVTAGGLYNNYELGLRVELDLAIDADAVTLQDALDYRRWFLQAGPACVELTPELLEAWRAQPPVPIADERRPRRSGGSSGATRAPSVFGKAISGLPSAPTSGSPGSRSIAAEPQGFESTDHPGSGTSESGSSNTVVRRWTKKLPKSDAQQPTAGSNPTGNLRLTKAGHPIDWRTFFRHDLFPTAAWRTEVDAHGQPVEKAMIPFSVRVGSHKSTDSLTVSHASHRESGQANHTTVLHWGPLLPVLTATDYTGEYVALSRLTDGSFELEIVTHDPGAIT